MEINCLWKGQNALGEGPLWHPQEKALYWIDLVSHTLHRLDPLTHAYQEWQLPGPPGTIVPRARGGLVATLGNKVIALTLPDLTLTTLAEITPWPNDNYMNDGKCDRQGRLWFGVASTNTENPTGGLFCLTPSGQLTQKEQHITISNGLGFSPDNKKFYYTDGLRYRIYQYDFNLQTGELCNRQVFLQLPVSPIEPDGLTVDAHGYLWEAQWNSGCVFRYTPEGQIDQVITLPVSRPTSCTIGGPNLNTLYITSCARGQQDTLTLPSPAGALFSVTLPIQGVPEPAFAG